MARENFPDGVLVEGGDISEALETTVKLIQRGVSIIFEAAFLGENLFVRPDIIERNKNGTWNIIEVKSAKEAKESHIIDVAFQKHVLEASDLIVQDTFVMHVNGEMEYPDLSSLFTLEEVTEEVKLQRETVEKLLLELKPVLKEKTAPDVLIGSHCLKPSECHFKGHCWAEVPAHSIFTIPRLSADKKNALVEDGLLCIDDLPLDYKLTPSQKKYVDSVREKQSFVESDKIREALSELSYPLYFFDFETDSPAIPMIEGCKPYERFPFQYSCHVLHKDGSLDHVEYLHLESSDPRPHLVDALLEHLGNGGTIVAYSASFEKGVLSDLAKVFPVHASYLLTLVERIWDQLKLLSKYYVHPDFLGSYSIKNVLPVLVPGLSYDDLEIKNGSEAQAIWYRMINTSDEAERALLEGDLRKYCERDTFAMVQIHQMLSAL